MNDSGVDLGLCYQDRVEVGTQRALLQYFYPAIIFLSIVSNSICIAVYRHPFLCASPTVRMLTAKAVANIIFCISFTPNIAYALHHQDVITEDDVIAVLYWDVLKYQLFVCNCLATFSVWMTVFVMGDHYLLVVRPVGGARWSSLKTANYIIIGSLPVSVVLHLHLLLNRTVEVHTNMGDCIANTTTLIYEFVDSSKPNGRSWLDPTYSICKALIHTVIPLFVLAFSTYKLWNRLVPREASSHNNDKKQTVIRLALANTLCHFVLESMDGVIHMISAVEDSTFDHQLYSEPFVAIGNLCSVINASICLFVFLGCSPRFRLIVLLVMGVRKESVVGEDQLQVPLTSSTQPHVLKLAKYRDRTRCST